MPAAANITRVSTTGLDPEADLVVNPIKGITDKSLVKRWYGANNPTADESHKLIASKPDAFFGPKGRFRNEVVVGNQHAPTVETNSASAEKASFKVLTHRTAFFHGNTASEPVFNPTRKAEEHEQTEPASSNKNTI